MKVVKALRLTGVLVDTYDSSRYETNKDSFVSYASIVFSYNSKIGRSGSLGDLIHELLQVILLGGFTIAFHSLNI